jgi:DDE superfamily endonuclease
MTPIVRVPAGGRGRVNIAGLTCYRPGHRAKLIYRIRMYRGRPREDKSFPWSDYRDLLAAAHQQLGAPIVLVWDNLGRHKVPQMREFIDAHDWLTVFHLPSYAPELNPVEGIWSLIKRGALANLAAPNLAHVLNLAKHALKKLQYRPDVIDGVLTETGLIIET